MFQISVVAKGVEKRLSELGYNVESVVGKFEDIDYLVQSTDLFVLYLPGDIADDQLKIRSLSHICTTLSLSGRTTIVIGEWKYHEELVKVIPSLAYFEWMERPLDMNKFTILVEKIKSESHDLNEKRRILIVDDDPSYAKMVREWIKEKYRVDIVTAGMQAISFLLKVKEEDKVDMILLDYEMPVVDGPQVLQMLRQEPATAGIPVIFLTGVSTKEAVSRVMALKPDGYILKSATRESILTYLAAKLR